VNVQALHDLSPSGWNSCAFPHRFAFDGGDARNAAAAVVREIAKQRVHGLELGRVDHRAAIPAHRDKAGGPQPVKMKRQGVRREIQSGCDGARGQAIGAGLYKQAENVKAIILGECGQSRYGIGLFHISMNIEIIIQCQLSFQCLLKYYFGPFPAL
jgi:hypothetical protein